ncbi:hypothetical protein SAMN02982929_02376 [Saccharopolyspora kobensis]|uniref:Uncharacterized protein n=1 Tax=Saccharopolyspora kobensis TaxID=146035 RepID=A0A1H6AKF8_9PSEU|nr:hypothetical protein [Saccharopolyspora kobensis]SEG49209.1 hypothetical protein SAMN02982929_02376 [Saccharopolyspora kobensis]SFE59138.1 hypothetical protein SAMN05216506_112210 [Saccharopolyspora kobensis]
MGDNYGIQIGGSGRLRAESVAAGEGAQAFSTGGSEELREQVRALLAALRSARDDGELDSDDVLADAELLDAEVNDDSPDKSKVLGLLSRLSSAVAQFGDLATAVRTARDAVDSLSA